VAVPAHPQVLAAGAGFGQPGRGGRLITVFVDAGDLQSEPLFLQRDRDRRRFLRRILLLC
jgi:hypothetical protein